MKMKADQPPARSSSFPRRQLIASASALGLSACATGKPQGASGTAPAAAPAKPGKTPNTPFAVNIEMWWKGPVEQRLEQAAALGFPGIEFWPYQDKDIDAMAATLRKHGMTCAQFTGWGFGKELNHPEVPADKFLAAIEESCEVAARLPGCEMFTVVAGDDIEGLSKAQMHEAIIAKLKQAVPILEAHRKMIILEPMNPYNHPNHCLYGSKDGIAICEAVGSEWVKLNWDLFHMQRYEGNLIANLREGQPFIGYLQLADSPDRNEPGTGELNYTNVFKVIRELGYDKLVGVECNPQDGDTTRAARRLHTADTW